MREITCRNNNGASIVFGEKAFTPFLLAHIDGLYDSKNEISILENAVLDGGGYQGSLIKTRNIVLTVTDKPNTRYGMKSRDVLRGVFVKGAKGTLIYEEDGIKRSIDYYVESVSPGERQLYIISLICPDPYFYDLEYTVVSFTSWSSGFEFPHEFKKDGEELGIKQNRKTIVNIDGKSFSPVGVIFKIKANGDIINPAVVNITTSEFMMLGNEDHPFEMRFGDVLTIVTEDGNKNVTLERDGVQTSVNQYITEDSIFIQLGYGNNYFGYRADSGFDNIDLEILYKNRYEGA